MAAIPNKERIISAIALGAIAGTLYVQPQIEAYAGGYGAVASIAAIAFFIGFREVVKELGLQKGDLNTSSSENELEPED